MTKFKNGPSASGSSVIFDFEMVLHAIIFIVMIIYLTEPTKTSAEWYIKTEQYLMFFKNGKVSLAYLKMHRK